MTREVHMFNASTNFEIIGCNSYRKINIFYFFHMNAYGTKFDLGEIYLRVKLGSYFLYIMISLYPQCYILSFIIIRTQILEKKILKSFYHL